MIIIDFFCIPVEWKSHVLLKKRVPFSQEKVLNQAIEAVEEVPVLIVSGVAVFFLSRA